MHDTIKSTERVILDTNSFTNILYSIIQTIVKRIITKKSNEKDWKWFSRHTN